MRCRVLTQERQGYFVQKASTSRQSRRIVPVQFVAPVKLMCALRLQAAFDTPEAAFPKDLDVFPAARKEPSRRSQHVFLILALT